MSVELKLSALPESVHEGVIQAWLKKEGDAVRRDEKIAEVETDKVVLDVAAEVDGRLSRILKKEGETVAEGEVFAIIEEGEVPAAAAEGSAAEDEGGAGGAVLSPAAQKIAAEHGIDPAALAGTGRGGRVTKADILEKLSGAPAAEEGASRAEDAGGAARQTVGTAGAAVAPETERAPETAVAERAAVAERSASAAGARPESRVRMSRLRARIAQRLLEAQRTAAILTTFNEVNLQAVIDLRRRYRDSFEKEHGVKLGFMSFFVKATVEALKKFPAVNASVDGEDIIYHGYFDIGIAVDSPRGLVVPILRDADQLSFAEVESGIRNLAERARDGKLTMEDLTGGTFTITNGGVFGSLLSTPIINPPQSAILGMHKIEDRPVAESGQVVIRPVMYVALSYDHRIIDGRDAVSFLVTVKEQLEDPARMLLNL
ncbi:MAG: 2-oxoglutarate dehydrogenase complex dihydrolipoyllysine-residue succinyltransferase [Planctomycetes bacterium]|nr:2-oxoglutarate dehydrogenase complex dihydrolipoyllysine-residue succinyltransferase [Planctomycetota bacterium]